MQDRKKLPYDNIQAPNGKTFQLLVGDSDKADDVIDALSEKQIVKTTAGCDHPRQMYSDFRCYKKPKYEYDTASTSLALYSCDNHYNNSIYFDTNKLLDVLKNECAVPNVDVGLALGIGLGVGLGIPTLAFICVLLFRLCNRYHNQAEASPNQEARVAPYQVLEEIVIEQPEEKLPARPVELTLRERLAKCYKGDIPPDFTSIFSTDIMNNPIMLRCGDNYDKEDIDALKKCACCPKCRDPFDKKDFSNPAKNTFLRSKIISFVEKKEKLFLNLNLNTHEENSKNAQVYFQRQSLFKKSHDYKHNKTTAKAERFYRYARTP